MKNKILQQLNEYASQVSGTLWEWEKINKNGCNDPFWPDGSNLNLLRNHMIYYKSAIKGICEQNKIDLPGQYFIPTPPLVDNNYLAKPKTKRAKTIIENYGPFGNADETTKAKNFNSKQLRMFD